jgi:peptidoglycan/xylan/chitin deacetylase (PgdA/CDA1 family)
MSLQILLIVSLVAVAIFILFGVVLWLHPEWLISKLRRRSPDVLYSVETEKPIVALTIDDGPDANDSQKILTILQEFNARATFFLITDHVPGNEAIVERMVLDGHELGNHLTADEPSIALSHQDFECELIKADDVLSNFMDVHWLRPGSGWYNEAMLETIKKYDYRCALGSVYPYDPQVGNFWFSAFYVLWKIKPGAVIVMHDHNRRGERTAKALKIILPKLENRGYRVVTLSELSSLQPLT